MSRLNQPVSGWIESMDRQLVRAKHILLHGSTSDLALYSGMTGTTSRNPECTKFDTVLHRYLIDAGFALVLHLNLADGLQLAEQSMAERFQQAYAAAMGAATGQRFDNQLNVAGDTAGACETTRQLLRQNSVSCAVVLHFADKLVSGADHLNPDDLPILVRLRQAMEGGVYATGQTGLRNSLVVVANRVTDIPTWLYVDNPRIDLVQVSRPTARERRELIMSRLGDFYLPTEESAERQADLTRELADRTDGMSLFDISLLPRVSHAEAIPLSDPQSLVRASRHGKKEDPWAELGPKRLESAPQILGTRVKGQDAAINHVVSTLHLAHEGLDAESPRSRGGPPKGILFFVGPTGVGKTELAKSLAELVFGDEDRMKVFDMAEFQGEESGNRLAGAPPSYVGYEQGGQLTNHVLAQPFSIILFDEMEKASQSVNEKFLGILEEGRLTDGRGMTAYFDQSMLVFTSNIGSDRLIQRLQGNPNQQPSYQELRELYLAAVGDHFAKKFNRPELLGRYGDNIIVFDMLRPELVGQLCDKFLDQLYDNAQRQRQLDLQIDRKSIIAYFTRSMSRPENLALGGRRVRELIKSVVVRPLNDYLFTKKPSAGAKLHLSISEDKDRINVTAAGS